MPETKKTTSVKPKQVAAVKKKSVKSSTPAKESKWSTKLIRQGLVPTLSNYFFGPAGAIVSGLTPFNARQAMAAFMTGDSNFSLKDAPEGVQRALYESIAKANSNNKEKTKGEFRGTQYKDYSPEMEDVLQNLKGSMPSVLKGSLLSDDFNAATTFGRVSYKDNPETNSYDVYDNYDFTTTNDVSSPYARIRNMVGDLAKGTPLDPTNKGKSNYIGSFKKEDWDKKSKGLLDVPFSKIQKTSSSGSKKVVNKKQDGGWLNKFQNGGEEEKTYGTYNLPEVVVTPEPEEKGFWKQSIRSYLDENKDAGFLGALGSVVTYPLGLPQQAMMYGLTGKVQKPSESLGINNRLGALATDIIADPTNLLGVGIADDALKLSSKAGKFFTEETALKNAYKINPFAFKPNSESAYRMIGGKEGYLDAINSGEIRAMENGVYGDAHFNMGLPLNPNRLSSEELLKAGSPGGYKGPYMVERRWADNAWNKHTMTDAFKNSPEIQEELIKLGKDKDVWGKYGNLETNDNAVRLYKEDWLQGYKEIPKKEDGGWLSKFDVPEAQNGIEGTMGGLTDQGFNYNGAWGGPSMAMGGSLPGSVGFSYARTQGSAPANGKYTKKTKASAQNGEEMKFYQEGLDWKPKSISRDGSSLPQAQGGTSLTQEEQQIIQDRKNRIKASIAAREKGSYTKDNWRQQLADESQAIGDKFRIFPDDPNSIIDEYFNPGVTIGSMASELGSAPLRAQQEESYLPYAMGVGAPLLTGALEGLGVKSNKEFAKNIINPFNFPGQEYVKNLLGKTANKISKSAGNFAQDFSKGYRAVPTKEDGGIIEDDRGQWEYPGEITKINSNQITMQGVPYPVMGISDTGDTQMMQPGQDYTYEGESVTEYPMMKYGGNTSSTITCPNCGWSWKKSEAGNDPYVCHKCGMNNASKLQNNKKENGGWLSKYN